MSPGFKYLKLISYVCFVEFEAEQPRPPCENWTDNRAGEAIIYTDL